MISTEVSTMKKILFLIWIAGLLAPGAAFSATLQNMDSQAYELQIQESGRSYSSQYRIIENAQVEICFNGCAMTMLATGQTVQVNPNDSVVIDSGVMSVTAGN
jgi:long-subunit fatty acid transport protein